MTLWTLPMLRVRPPRRGMSRRKPAGRPRHGRSDACARRRQTRKRRTRHNCCWSCRTIDRLKNRGGSHERPRRQPQQQRPQRRQQRQKDQPSTPGNQHCHCGRLVAYCAWEHWVTHVAGLLLILLGNTRLRVWLQGWGEVLCGYWSGNTVTSPVTHAVTGPGTHAVSFRLPTGPVTGPVTHAATSLLHNFVHSFQDQPTAAHMELRKGTMPQRLRLLMCRRPRSTRRRRRVRQ